MTTLHAWLSALHAPLSESVRSLRTDLPRHVLGMVGLYATFLIVFLVAGMAWAALAQLSFIWMFVPLALVQLVLEQLPRAVAAHLMPVALVVALVGGAVAWLAAVCWTFWFLAVATVAGTFPTRFAIWAGRVPNPLTGLILWLAHAAVWGASLVVPVAPVLLVGLLFGLVPPLVAADRLPIHTAVLRLLAAWWRAPGATLRLSAAALTASPLGLMFPLAGPTVAAEFQVRCARQAVAR